MNYQTGNISKYIDYHLQPIVKQIPSYVKDINGFINKINAIKSVAKNSYLVKMDVRSLHTNMPNAEGISAVTRAFNNYSKNLQPPKLS